jgi:nucleoid-associated protein YgaU
MDQGVRVVLSMGIVTGGTVLALLFRHPSPPIGTPVPETGQTLVLRGTIAAEPAAAVSPSPPPIPEPTPAVAPLPPRASLATNEPPPLLARSYPEPVPLSASGWGATIGLGPFGPAYQTQLPRSHTIVDGDTLPALAERYLGSADRALEIYAANKNLLPGPDVLPIGVELQIPLAKAAAR